MEPSLIIVLLAVLLIVQAILLWSYFRRRRRSLQKSDETPNFEIVRKALLKQLRDLGVRKPEIHLFSARFALEGQREGNARKIQTSGVHELQYHILETIRDRGAQLKIRTAAYLFIDYIERVIETITGERERLREEKVDFDSARRSWNERRAEVDEVIEVCCTRVKNFFSDRIPNAESFAEREAVTVIPSTNSSKDFSTIVVKQSEVHVLSGQISAQVNEALMSLGEWFWEQTGSTPVVPEMPAGFDEKTLRRLKALAGERASGSDDGTPAVVTGLMEVQTLLQQAFSELARENVEKMNEQAQKFFDANSVRIETRATKIEAALKTFQSLRNEFHAHE